jgi:hypothetical protein
MRVRKVVTRSGRHHRGKFPSIKLGRMVQWESFLERDAILHFEYHPLVVSYQEQPSIETFYDKSGELRTYFPDFRVDFDDGRELFVEVKPAEKLKDPQLRDRLDRIAARFKEQGRLFKVMTDVDIRREPLLGNLKRLHEVTRLGHDDIDQRLIAMPRGRTWTLGSFIRAMTDEARAFAMLGLGYIRADLEAELCDDTEVCLEGTEGGPDGAFRI